MTGSPAHSRRWWLHLGGLCLLTVALGILFLRPTKLGDDFTYWSYAFDLHERGLDALQPNSFHDLRWPVWGVCWLLQALVGPGLLSFYGAPLLYLATGAALSFTFARLIGTSLRVAWAAGIAFFFLPVLDTVCYRPMPDLSEGVWGAVALLGWWGMMQAPSRLRALALAILTGACVYISETNRITGAFIVPVLLVATLVYQRRRFHWLVIAGLFALAFYCLECALYKHLFDDWLHNIHANLGNKDAKGTDAVHLWALPFRFLDTLWKGNPLAPIYCLAAVFGIWNGWKTRTLRTVSPGAMPFGVIVLWLGVLYMEYACAPQSLWPWRPMVRDADRFLCGLAVPLALTATFGIAALVNRASAWRPVAFLCLNPLLAGALSIALMAGLTSRETLDPGFIRPMRDYLQELPANTKVFTHGSMRALCFLVEPDAARRIHWFAPEHILYSAPELEAMAAQADQFWYIRKLVWLNTRKKLERRTLGESSTLASYFAQPRQDWVMSRLLAKGDTPDLIFHRRRTPSDPPAKLLRADSPELAALIGPLPLLWDRKLGSLSKDLDWEIPPSLRGKLVRIDCEAASDRVEALTVRLRFLNPAAKLQAEYLLKPYLHTESAPEFFAFAIPKDATRCHIQVRTAKDTKSIQIESLSVVVETPGLPPAAPE